MIFPEILSNIQSFSEAAISAERKEVLKGLVDYIQSKKINNESVRLNFICTHNSRRSHLSQVWAQTMAYHFNVTSVYCYSGGTEATAMFPKAVETLLKQGFKIEKLSEGQNPVYAVKYADNEAAVVCFSKKYSDSFNPHNAFGAVVTCNSADEACPIVLGAEARFPIKYEDPKAFDNTPLQSQMYAERSLEIAQELWWVFSQVKP